MAEIRVRNLPSDVVGEWKDRAKRHGRSLEAELRELITDRGFFRSWPHHHDGMDGFFAARLRKST